MGDVESAAPHPFQDCLHLIFSLMRRLGLRFLSRETPPQTHAAKRKAAEHGQAHLNVANVLHGC